MTVFTAIVLAGGIAMAEELAAKAAGGKTALIAAEKSPFKNALVAKLQETLKAKGCTPTVIDLNKLAKTEKANCSAIVIVNSVPEWRKGKAVDALLAESSAEVRKKTVVVTTTRGTPYQPAIQKVDAITTASKKSEIDAVVARVAKRLDAVLGEKGK